MYHYEECGLDNIFLVNGYSIEESPYGETVAIDDVDGLHALISNSIASAPGRLSGKEIRFLRTEMDMSQVNLATMLKVDAQTVARWEKGETEVPGPADGMVRVLYLAQDEHDGIKRLLEILAELDDLTKEDRRFEEFDGHWRLAA